MTLLPAGALETAMPADAAMLARRSQEWLCHHGLHVVIDGDVGPATRSAIRFFQVRRGILGEVGIGAVTWKGLVEPMRNALQPVRPLASDSLGRLVCCFAGQHLRQRPREIGGPNRGPWVRLYMGGREGKDWPWCAGFATFLIHQAAEQVGVDPPLPIVFDCDQLVDLARAQGLFIDRVRPEPGWLFLLPAAKKHHWAHVGIVVATDGVATMTTIEGNTNQDGSADGFEVCRRTRAFAGKGFIRL